MKYIIVINQEAIVRMGLVGKIKANHIAVLEAINSMNSSTFDSKIIDGARYVKTFYSVIAKEIPLFELSASRVKQLVVELEEMGFLKRSSDCAESRCLWVSLNDLYYDYQRGRSETKQPDNNLTGVGQNFDGGVGQNFDGNQYTNTSNKEEGGVSTSPKAKKHLELLEIFRTAFSSPEYMEAVELLIEDRKERKKNVTPRAAKLMVKDFLKWGEAKTVASINKSVKNGWTGVFECDIIEATAMKLPNVKSSEAKAVHDKLIQRIPELTQEECAWVFDYQHRTSTSYVEYPDHIRLVSRTSNLTKTEADKMR